MSQQRAKKGANIKRVALGRKRAGHVVRKDETAPSKKKPFGGEKFDRRLKEVYRKPGKGKGSGMLPLCSGATMRYYGKTTNIPKAHELN